MLQILTSAFNGINAWFDKYGIIIWPVMGVTMLLVIIGDFTIVKRDVPTIIMDFILLAADIVFTIDAIRKRKALKNQE